MSAFENAMFFGTMKRLQWGPCQQTVVNSLHYRGFTVAESDPEEGFLLKCVAYFIVQYLIIPCTKLVSMHLLRDLPVFNIYLIVHNMIVLLCNTYM